jgi:hypothetical protein
MSATTFNTLGNQLNTNPGTNPDLIARVGRDVTPASPATTSETKPGQPAIDAATLNRIATSRGGSRTQSTVNTVNQKLNNPNQQVYEDSDTRSRFQQLLRDSRTEGVGTFQFRDVSSTPGSQRQIDLAPVARQVLSQQGQQYGRQIGALSPSEKSKFYNILMNTTNSLERQGVSLNAQEFRQMLDEILAVVRQDHPITQLPAAQDQELTQLPQITDPQRNPTPTTANPQSSQDASTLATQVFNSYMSNAKQVGHAQALVQARQELGANSAATAAFDIKLYQASEGIFALEGSAQRRAAQDHLLAVSVSSNVNSLSVLEQTTAYRMFNGSAPGSNTIAWRDVKFSVPPESRTRLNEILGGQGANADLRARLISGDFTGLSAQQSAELQRLRGGLIAQLPSAEKSRQDWDALQAA